MDNQSEAEERAWATQNERGGKGSVIYNDFTHCKNIISSYLKVNMISSCEDNNDVICRTKFGPFNC